MRVPPLARFALLHASARENARVTTRFGEMVEEPSIDALPARHELDRAVLAHGHDLIPSCDNKSIADHARARRLARKLNERRRDPLARIARDLPYGPMVRTHVREAGQRVERAGSAE